MLVFPAASVTVIKPSATSPDPAVIMREFAVTSLYVIPVGTEIDIHMGSAVLDSKMRLVQGTLATLMVRPEAVNFLTEDGTADFVVEGALKAEYALGSRTQYKIEADNGDELAVENLREDRFSGKVGDRVRLGWNAEYAHMITGD